MTADIKVQSPESLTWTELLQVYSRPRVIAMMFLGFSGGLPFLLVFSTLTAWLRDEGVSKSAIGFFAWVGITYSIKVIWAPIIDRYGIPWLTQVLGQRRSWMLVGQLGIAGGLLAMSFLGTSDLYLLSIAALAVAFSSATQDVAIDAYRIEAMEERFQGAMSAMYIFGYRVALLVAGAGAFYLAEYFNWVVAYQAMAGAMLLGMVTSLTIAEPVTERAAILANQEGEFGWRVNFVNAVLQPFLEFFRRQGQFALVILLFIAVFRLSDIAMGIMANPFYLDMGYSKTDIANVAKVFGFFMSIAGAAIAGLLVVKWGIYRCLMIGAVAVASTNVLFAVLSLATPELSYLAIVISADNISGGFAATAFVAYLSSLTNRAYTATQYALFSSLMTLPGKFMSGFSGLVVDGYGYFEFFLIAAALGLPAIFLVRVLTKHDAKLQEQQEAPGQSDGV